MMSETMSKPMWRVTVVKPNSDMQPVQEFFYFWDEVEATEFYTKVNRDSFNSPEGYKYALAPAKVK
jgi:hypothetical protein